MTTQTNGNDCRESGAGQTSRQQFEAWAGSIYDTRLLKDEKGNYGGKVLQQMWEAWQSSRSTIEITPPKFIDSREALSKGFMVDYSNGYGDAMDAYEERLKEAGITVKE